MKAVVGLLVAAGVVLGAQTAAAEPALAISDVNLRGGPGTDYPRLGTIPGGSTVDAVNCQGEWCQAQWQGQTGWVNNSYLDFGGGAPPGGGAPVAGYPPPPDGGYPPPDGYPPPAMIYPDDGPGPIYRDEPVYGYPAPVYPAPYPYGGGYGPRYVPRGGGYGPGYAPPPGVVPHGGSGPPPGFPRRDAGRPPGPPPGAGGPSPRIGGSPGPGAGSPPRGGPPPGRGPERHDGAGAGPPAR